ncbi:hypothetical protein SBOR_1522 [Sclerotinia borealis F-4128]|uniref:TERF2-interacting telomeric protein 1 Myb domain-containing protein n=1 Tax=Sclerotinia borealis (strain F-4128) TaxID=1432307 RepID=W9CQ06_SCLBF|nr:hypothetical protein SBOR_1522 [Sclerotinia borealis F-4128]
MESPTKRQKISAEHNDVDLEINDDYSETNRETEEDDFIVDDEYDDILYEPGYDPDQELQQKRARLDYKLKSTFESIFEKYGKDFEGVGDEIDLRTGEILVDNGHLKEMQDERDAGNLLRALTVEPESVTETSGDEYSIEEEGEDGEERNDEHDETEDGDNAVEISDGDMEEDDMILRGYDEPNQDPFVDVVATTELGPAQNDFQDVLQNRRNLQIDGGSDSFPSYNELLRSFGPEVAPQIVNIISRQQGQDDSHIEPAWRVPELPASESRKRPALRALVPEPESGRSPSPDMSESIWALPKGRRPRGPYKPRGPKFLGDKRLLSDELNTSDYTALSSPRLRNFFTKEEDESLIAKVAEARDQGLPFLKESIWEELESQNARHSKSSWKTRYRSKYSHLWSPADSTRPRSRGPYRTKCREELKPSINSTSRSPHPVYFPQRPSRTRKPTQQGSNLVSWTDAVATIKSLDPRLHKDLAKDASFYDLTDVKLVDVNEDALNLRSSDLELSKDNDDEPGLPAHTGSGVQRIAPVTINPAYEFSDEEAVPDFKATQPSDISTSKLKEKKGSWLKTPQPEKGMRKSNSSTLKEGTSGKMRSRHSKARKELSAEWPQLVPTACPEKFIAQYDTVELADTPKNTNIDLFDIDQLPETSPRSALDARQKSRTNKKFSSDAVIPSTSSQLKPSPTAAIYRGIRSRTQQRTDSVDDGPVPPTSSLIDSSPTPRPKRKFTDTDEKATTSLTATRKVDQETNTSMSDTEDMPLQNMIDGNTTPTPKSVFAGGIITSTHSETNKSRTPLLDFTTPTRRDLTRKGGLRDASRSPGMVKTLGGTMRKCGKGGFLCKQSFCFKCGVGSKSAKC